MWNRLIGHDAIVAMLRRVARSERVGHAYLFMGQRGVGKYTTAKLFAQAILCAAQDGPCGECESCHLFELDNHPDYCEISPLGQNFRISQIRELNTQVLLRPVRGERRVYVLHNVEKLTADAANSFLRTLEEPPHYATFLLLADSSDVLSTVLSRCQVLRFGSLTREETLEVVSAQSNSMRAPAAAKSALGSPGDALHRLADNKHQEIWAQTERLACEWPTLSIEDKLRWLKTLESEKEALLWTLEHLSTWVRDVMLYKLGLELHVANENTSEIRRQAELMDYATVFEKWQGLMTLQVKWKQNINRRMVLDELLLVL